MVPLYVQNPFDRVSLDIIGPLLPSDGYRYVLVIVDAASGWCELHPLLSADAVYVAHVFFSEWVCRYGLPKAFMADNDTAFLNKMLNTLLRVMRVRRLSITGYRPQTNGKVE